MRPPFLLSRKSRAVIPGIAHHITQRGNNRRDIFFRDADRHTYLALLQHYCTHYDVAIMGFCLMTNHVHFIATPSHENGLAKAFGRTHNDYSRWLNVGRRESGHVWQNRFYSCALDGRHLWQALAYVERNPVRAGLASNARDWLWSSAAAHLQAEPNAWFQMEPWQQAWTAESWSVVLEQGLEEASLQVRLAEATRLGRPLGDETFIKACEQACGSSLRPQKRGPKRNETKLGGLAAQVHL